MRDSFSGFFLWEGKEGDEHVGGEKNKENAATF